MWETGDWAIYIGSIYARECVRQGTVYMVASTKTMGVLQYDTEANGMYQTIEYGLLIGLEHKPARNST